VAPWQLAQNQTLAPSRLFGAAFDFPPQPNDNAFPLLLSSTPTAGIALPIVSKSQKASSPHSPTMAEIKIDSKAFQERLSHFVTAWKADKRSGDALFAGASSIVILMGKVDEEPEFYKNNAMHVGFARRRARWVCNR
jgi:hypothetical protein